MNSLLSLISFPLPATSSLLLALPERAHVRACVLGSQQRQAVDASRLLVTLVRSDEDAQCGDILEAHEAKLNGLLALCLRLGELELLRWLERLGIVEAES